MIAPVQGMLASTMANILQLVGALLFCFLTSWRLSMLAFTTIIPITYVTGRYAKWSSRLSSQIYASLGQSIPPSDPLPTPS
jgi:ATP-binding cassette subfamily B protein